MFVFVEIFGSEPKVTPFIGFTDSAGSVLLFEILHSEARITCSNGRLQIFHRIAHVNSNSCQSLDTYCVWQKYVKYGEP